MPLTDEDASALLAPAGIGFIRREPGEIRTPLSPGQAAASMRSEDGRFDCSPEEVVDVDDPDFVRKVNAAWARMAEEYGLFDQKREFLLMVDDGESWLRVRLEDVWDIAGRGGQLLRNAFAGILTSRYVPEFTVLSKDRKVLMSTTVWGNGKVSTIAIRPDRLGR